MANNPLLDGILEKEGGYVNHPADRGGPTNWGITERTAREWGYTGDMRDLTRSEAWEILEANYWIKPGFDKVAKVSLLVAYELCDAGVNVGPAQPSRWLQRWLNVFNLQEKRYADIAADGIIGRNTLQALNCFLEDRGKEGETVHIAALNCSQGHYYLGVTEARPQNEAFIYGWLRERVVVR